MIGLGLFLGLFRRSVIAPTPPPSYTPSADFSDGRNSQYVSILSAFSG